MAAGRWHYKHQLKKYLKGYRVAAPAGPMELEPNEEAVWLGAWITQRATGATQWTVTTDFPDEANWVAGSGSGNGSFQPGGAIGYSLLVTNNTFKKTTGYYYWDDELLLVDEKFVVTPDLIRRFEEEIQDFKDRQGQIGAAIDRAYKRLGELKKETMK